jgi:hypothetical protein
MFAFGFGAVASVPQHPITATAAAAVVPLSSSIQQLDEPMPHQAGDEPLAHPAHVAVMVYVLATPEPAPTPQYAPFVARPMAAIGPFSGAGNGFDYGYCTWWVAQKRHIPWRGNAVEWWWNARPFGFAEGPTPRAGAIMVMGISGTSPLGHVAYVESVRPDGSFFVSEMNWWGVPGGGWNRVDYRTVTSMRGVLGFIY